MFRYLACVVAACSAASAAAGAEHEIEINNTYFLAQEQYPIRGGVYFTQDNRGVFEVVKGPFKDGPARCIGSGFVFRDRPPALGGICIFGDGDDTFTMSWKVKADGLGNDWSIAGGTGRYEGMTGQGVATTDIKAAYQAKTLRKTHIVGTVDLPEE